MKHFTIPFLLSVAVLSAGMVNRASAHEGHKKTRTQQRNFESERVPVKSPRRTYGPERFAPPATRQTTPPARHDRRVLNLRTLAIRLEFAAEIISEEIHFDMPSTSHVEHLLATSREFEMKAHHFRESLEQGFDAEHLRTDLHAVSDAFASLGRSLRHYHGSFSVARAMSRTDRIIGTITRAMLNRQDVPNLQQTPRPGNFSGESARALPPQLPIPEEMNGISLLPREQQESALAQKTCPVTGDLLGSLGKPLMVRIDERTIFVCCDDCVEEIKASPKKYLTEGS